MFIDRKDIIEGIIKMTFRQVDDRMFQKMMIRLGFMTNDDLSNQYFKITGNHIRQIFSNQFICLT
jgi:hypothetical protein